MPDRARLPRLFFRLACGFAGLLVVLVLLAPRLDSGRDPPGARPGGLARVVALFARDGALRRTSLASAAGLLVTACVFFQPPPGPPPARRPRAPGVAGA
jgi:hypothetical protein